MVRVRRANDSSDGTGFTSAVVVVYRGSRLLNRMGRDSQATRFANVYGGGR